MTRSMTALFAGLVLGILMTGCSSPQKMPTVDHVDLDRYMGDWYVIANIPTFLERDAYNALEQYALNDDGTIATTFSFNKGGFDGPRREYNPTGFVQSEDNAEWGMRFLWPFKAEFLIIYLDEAYSQTVIGRSKRDYVWIMAREPEMPEDDYQAILAYLDELGYDTDEIQRVPQRWDD
ncbi:membrane protein [Thioalkalivibrio versutus]|uniref:Outer membrane lipoprotein Blc n=1 Tax=Thioalkalivibrio versutus TaxID=106634 RepID=A0A0G3G9U8_9GAMM|nr:MULTISPECIES: lipocalin family protein [Thioalkalivibrio]AKJ95586.1 membrane protein [Thioalkalivibrio versutus]